MSKSHRRSKFAIGGIGPNDAASNKVIGQRTRLAMRKARKATARSHRQSQKRGMRIAQSQA